MYDTEDSLVGWTIVGVGEDSLLLQDKTTARRRYSFGEELKEENKQLKDALYVALGQDKAREGDIEQAWERTPQYQEMADQLIKLEAFWEWSREVDKLHFEQEYNAK